MYEALLRDREACLVDPETLVRGDVLALGPGDQVTLRVDLVLSRCLLPARLR